MSAVFVVVRRASHAKAIAPPAATNWMISIVAMLKASDMPIVSAAKAPAMDMTVWTPSLKSRYAPR